MVHLILSSTKGIFSSYPLYSYLLAIIQGNQGLRYFPHLGYLGLTPVRVEGSLYLPFFFLLLSLILLSSRTNKARR